MNKVDLDNLRNRLEASRRSKNYNERTHVDVPAHVLEQMLDALEPTPAPAPAKGICNACQGRSGGLVGHCAICGEGSPAPASAPASVSSLNEPTNAPTARCPWCRVADVAVDSMQCSDRVVTGVDEDNGPVYWAECQRCGAQGPIVGWAADAIPKWNECTAPAPVTVSIERFRCYTESDAQGYGYGSTGKSDQGDYVRYDDHIAALESAHGAGDGWVSCSERMPEMDGLVLLWWRPLNGNPNAEAPVIGSISRREKGKWWNGQTASYQDIWHITHWRPLPSPPDDKAREE